MNIKRMKIITHGICLAGIVAMAVLVILLGGSSSAATSVQATYSLTKVNGEDVPAISWVTETDSERCEHLTSGGALLLNLEGRSGAFAMERVNCVSAQEFRTSSVNDFMIITGTYEISGNQIVIRDEVSTDRGTLLGDALTIAVVGVGDFEGQTTEYVFQLAR